MKKELDSLIETFKEKFGGSPDLVSSAPGRVNLIGEHTDYMGGLVLPVAIDRQVILAVRSVPGDTITGYSANFKESVSVKAGRFDPMHASPWLRYVLGVLCELDKLGIRAGGFEFCLAGNVPLGAGLSSSAALEVATARAVLDLLGNPLSKREMALLCQRAENDFVGMRCGIMDQFISSLGVADHALKIDCASLEFEPVAAAVPDHTWLVIDSGKKRGLVDSEYNLRRNQCQAGLQFLQARFPSLRGPEGVRALSLPDLQQFKEEMDPMAYRRIRHVVTENARVEMACEALKRGDLASLGACLKGSHHSLRYDYEVSCPELDTLVDFLCEAPGVVGARLTGAGFGGCAIALVREDALEDTVASLRNDFPKRHPGSLPPAAWPIRIADGAKTIFMSGRHSTAPIDAIKQGR